MILFCEECGTRHNIDEERLVEDRYQFSCHACHETLMVTRGSRKGKTARAALANPAVGASGGGASKPLEIMVVDDSKVIRKVLREIIESDGRKRVVGEAENGKKALELLAASHPDVITLDINMPVMDGLTTLKHIMIYHPVPTVMISALTTEGATETFESLKYGAIDFMPKPSRATGADLQTQKEEILRKIELASAVQMESVRYLRRPAQDKPGHAGGSVKFRYLVVMGVAEGGYGALLNVIPRLRRNLPAAYVAVMHQAPRQIDGFTRYLDQCSQLSVQRAGDGTMIQGGACYLAATTEWVGFSREGDRIRLTLGTSPLSGRGGAIDAVMASAARLMQERAAGVILTGAGDDGVEGLGQVIQKGGAVFVQDPRSCLFKETPMKAVDKYTVKNLVSDKQMAGAINAFLAGHTN
jgi:two-component system, chemotaxis family, protein-glutamate methylesterase/glutaminase